jgi:hypothetical protein
VVSSKFLEKIALQIEKALGPEIRITAIAPIPFAVDKAQIVSLF